jgi:hypothetical protein
LDIFQHAEKDVLRHLKSTRGLLGKEKEKEEEEEEEEEVHRPPAHCLQLGIDVVKNWWAGFFKVCAD